MSMELMQGSLFLNEYIYENQDSQTQNQQNESYSKYAEYSYDNTTQSQNTCTQQQQVIFLELDPIFDLQNIKFSCELEQQQEEESNQIYQQQSNGKQQNQIYQQLQQVNNNENIEEKIEFDGEDIFFSEKYQKPIHYNNYNNMKTIKEKIEEITHINVLNSNSLEKKQQIKQKNMVTTKKFKAKFLNTSHAANTLINFLTAHLIPIYYTKIICKNSFQMCMKPLQFIKNSKCSCQRCIELKFIYELKYSKNKNINMFKQLVDLTPRLKLMIEDFILNRVSIQLLNKKQMYKSQHTFAALYKTLHSFLKGNRKPDEFFRLV